MPVIARHGDIAKAGYFFVGENSVQHERCPPHALSAVRQFMHFPFGTVVPAYHPVLEMAFPVLAVEAISKVFHLADVRHMRLFPIHFQEEFPFDVSSDAFQGSLGASSALAENHAIISIADEFVPASFQFLVKLV